MKKNKKIIWNLSLIVLIVALSMASCEFISNNIGGDKTLPADEAKVEIRSANQEIIETRDAMFDSNGMGSLLYLLELMGGDDFKSAKIEKPFYNRQFTYSMFLNYFRGENALKSATIDEDDGYYGIMEYNYYSGSFDLVQEHSSMLQFNYPADDVAYTNQDNNAQLTISNLQFTEVVSYEEYWDYSSESYVIEETTEEVPIRAEVSLNVDGVEQLSADYTASYTSDGLPLSMSAGMDADDYVFSVSYSGSNTNYSTKMSQKQGNDELMGYDLKVTYTSDKEEVQKIDGYYLMAPLKFDGWINVYNVENYEGTDDEVTDEDLVYINSQMNIDVIHVDEKAKIGKLQYELYYDSDWEEYYPTLAIVYDDGTSEWLEDVFTFVEM
ncbi:MAG: hypothetical protein PF436_04885 [Prolixibacteraceae bacterium]|jgi:hypothetical protein|nr:hypothetical protein [Prolixibacteraceae bacterium]